MDWINIKPIKVKMSNSFFLTKICPSCVWHSGLGVRWWSCSSRYQADNVKRRAMSWNLKLRWHFTTEAEEDWTAVVAVALECDEQIFLFLNVWDAVPVTCFLLAWCAAPWSLAKIEVAEWKQTYFFPKVWSACRSWEANMNWKRNVSAPLLHLSEDVPRAQTTRPLASQMKWYGGSCCYVLGFCDK